MSDAMTPETLREAMRKLEKTGEYPDLDAYADLWQSDIARAEKAEILARKAHFWLRDMSTPSVVRLCEDIAALQSQEEKNG